MLKRCTIEELREYSKKLESHTKLLSAEQEAKEAEIKSLQEMQAEIKAMISVKDQDEAMIAGLEDKNTGSE